MWKKAIVINLRDWGKLRQLTSGYPVSATEHEAFQSRYSGEGGGGGGGGSSSSIVVVVVVVVIAVVLVVVVHKTVHCQSD